MTGIVFVPYSPNGSRCLRGIARGSGIVGRVIEDAQALIYFEGAVYGQSNIKTYADKVMIAYGRLRDRYPTAAMMVTPLQNVIRIGEVDAMRGTIELDGQQARNLLWDWLDARDVDAELHGLVRP